MVATSNLFFQINLFLVCRPVAIQVATGATRCRSLFSDSYRLTISADR